MVTLKCWLEVTQNHPNWYHSKAYLGMVSYSYSVSYSIVTVAVSLAISEI